MRNKKNHFKLIVDIKTTFSILNLNEDWNRRRESALEGNAAAMALLILQKIVMTTFDEPYELQLAMISTAFKRWEQLAIGQEVHLWHNVQSYASETGQHLVRETARCKALLQLRNLIEKADVVLR